MLRKFSVQKRELWQIIKVRRDKMIGHLLCHDSLTKNVLEGSVEDYIGRERPKMKYMKQIMIDKGKDSYKEL